MTLVDSLLYSVSHDLRSPLLTMSLSADLIGDALDALPESTSGSVAIALDALRHGAKDMERMLQALTMLSRARRRPVEPHRVSLSVILGGYVVVSEFEDLRPVTVDVDPLVVRELLDHLSEESPVEVYVRRRDQAVALECPGVRPEGEANSPLEALVASLQYHAGGTGQALAVSQVLLERQGASVSYRDDALVVVLRTAGGERS